jgi:DNA replication protein DnaC
MRYTNADIGSCDPKIKELVQKNIITVGDDTDKKYKLIKGVLFYGDTGRGKTYAMYAIKNWLGHSFNQSAITTWSEILFNMSIYYGDSKNHPNVIELLKDKKVIYIDDLGPEQKTEHNLGLLYMLVDHCYVYEKALILSTNLTLAEFVDKYGDRIATRILQMCVKYEAVGPNRRLEKK